MTINLEDLAAQDGPRYRALADAIAKAIDDGRLAPGAKLPPQRELADRLGITVGTVGRAYDIAAQRQLVTAHVGRGTFVLGQEEAPHAHDFIAAQDVPVSDPRHSPMDLRTNQPVPFAFEKLMAATREAMDASDPAAALFAYPPTAGHAQDRAAGAAWLRRHGVEAAKDDVIVTAGTEGGISVALAALTRPGDPLLAASLSYPHFHDMGGIFGLRRHAVELDEHGICPDALDAACRDTGARLLVVNVTLHNPTGSTMPEDRRRALIAVARQHDLVIVEDDVYGLLLEPRPPTLQSLAPERTIYVTSISKTLAPGLRLGFLIAPPDLHARLLDAQHTLLLGIPALTGKVFRHWLQSGLADEVVRAQRAETQARHQIARSTLGPLCPNRLGEGHHLWLRLPGRWRASALVERLKAANVHVLAGDLFAFGRARVPNAIRLSLSGAKDQAALRQALELLLATIERDARGHEVCA
ncbi:MAG: PLP-dependent aminotransferase family protein [Geminicoccaceae bacterium]|nr:MAG: PLP-dependent aminotransferase family protein [Geminicoccaceae bacterium]